MVPVAGEEGVPVISVGQPAAVDRAELVALLTAAPTLAGLCITVVALMNTLRKDASAATVVDDVLAICAGAFLLCTYLIFWALKARSPRHRAALARAVDLIFLAALSGMTVAGFISLHHLVT